VCRGNLIAPCFADLPAAVAAVANETVHFLQLPRGQV
jgi:hypothetical protein